MVIGLIGENCSGKSTMARQIAEKIPAEIITGKDYLRMAKNQGEAARLFKNKLHDAAAGENIIYVISEKDQINLLPDEAMLVLVKADISTIRERFSQRMHGSLPAPVEKMLEKKHGMFDEGDYDYIFDSTADDAEAFSELICEKLGRM